MTDEELIARLRNYGHVGTVLEAADRIEALVKERDDCAIYLKDGETPRQRMDRDHADVLSLMQLLSQEKSRAERLEAALTQMRDDRTAFRHAVHFRRFITTILKGEPK